MGDHEHGRAALVEFGQQASHSRASARVEVPGGLVGEHERWIANDCASNRNALSFASGQLVWAVLGTCRKTNAIQRGLRPPSSLAEPNTGIQQAISDIVEC
jgi:hypothetical protein